MSIVRPPPLPREHGAWAMLALPHLVGLAAAWSPAPRAWLVPPAMALLFLARAAGAAAGGRIVRGRVPDAGYVARRFLWAAMYLGGATVLLAAVYLDAPPAGRRAFLAAGAATLLLGGAHAAFALARMDRTLGGEIVGMAGLASAAPLILAASGRPLDGWAVGAGCACLIYFLSSLACVRAARASFRKMPHAWRPAFTWHLFLGVALGGLWAASLIPSSLPLAFLPVFARATWAAWRPPPNLRALGWREVGVACLFCGLAMAGYLT